MMTTLKDVRLPDDARKIGKDAFRECEALSRVTLPKSLKTIGKYAFSRCSSLKEIKLPSGIKTIKDGAFNQSGLEYIHIPESVTRIDEGAFSCDSLQEISVSEDNKAYANLCQRDGVLYSKDKTTLLAYPAASLRESYTIPDGVKRIGDMAFIWARNLRSVTVPASVTEIGDSAFFGCSLDNLNIHTDNPAYSGENGSLFNKDKTELFEIPHGYDSVFIPKSVTAINPMALENAQLNFTIICYKGSYAHKFAMAEAEDSGGMIKYALIGERYDMTLDELSEFFKNRKETATV